MREHGKELLAGLADGRYRKTEDTLRLETKPMMAGEDFRSALAFLFFQVLLAGMILMMAFMTAWKSSLAGGVGVGMFALLPISYGLFSTWRWKRVTLDAAGLWCEGKLAHISAWTRKYPLAGIVEFRVYGKGTVCARVTVRPGVVRKVKIYAVDTEIAECLAEEMNEILTRLREKAGIGRYLCGDEEIEKTWDAVRTPVRGTVRFQTGETLPPQGCRWVAEHEPAGVRFWRAAPTWKPLMICVLSAMICAAVICVFFPILEANRPVFEADALMIAVGVAVMLAGFGIFISCLFGIILYIERFAKEEYRIRGQTLQWRRYVVRDGGEACTLSLAGCAAVEMYACAGKRQSVGPECVGRSGMAEEYRLAFYDAQGKSLAEVIGLTREEAGWMRNEILAFFQHGDMAVAETAAAAVTVADEKASKMKSPVEKITFGQGWIACDDKKTQWGLLVILWIITGLFAYLPFADGNGPRHAEVLRRLTQTPVAQWELELALLAVVAGAFVLLVLAHLIPFTVIIFNMTYQRNTWRLDTSGFQYTFRAPFLRREITLPLSRVRCFRVETHEAINTHQQWLTLETTAGRMPLVQDAFALSLAEGPHTQTLREVAEAGNRLLAELGKSAVPEEDESRDVIGAFGSTHKPEIVLQADSRWKCTRDGAGRVEFRRREPFPWGGMMLPGIFVGMGAVGFGLLWMMHDWVFLRTLVKEMDINCTLDEWILGAAVFCGIMIAVAMVMGGMGVARWRWQPFILISRDDMRAGTVYGSRRREEIFPRAQCLAVRIKNAGRSLPLSWQKDMYHELCMTSPPYTLLLETPQGEIHSLATTLTLEEARLVRNEILRNV